MSDKKQIQIEVEHVGTATDEETGDVAISKRGIVKGFGRGLRDHITKGPKSVSISAEVVVGELPETHAHAGKTAVQIMLLPFPDRDTANIMADRVTAILEGLLNHKAIVTQ